MGDIKERRRKLVKEDILEFVEIYYKGNKENEDRGEDKELKNLLKKSNNNKKIQIPTKTY